MRFCIAIWAFLLLLATPVFGGGSSGEACKHDGKHGGEHKCEHKHSISLEYGWDISMSDEQLGKKKYEGNKFIRKVSSSNYAYVSFSKEWKEYSLRLYYNLASSDGLGIALVKAELPRSYLSVEVGKGELHFGGFWALTSPYLSYHSPFSYYGVMGRIFAPIEGLGELSLMVANDVMHDENAHGTGDTRRWNVTKQALAPLFQYKGKFDMVTPLLQFAFYDYKSESNWYWSWVATAGVKLAIDKMALSIDGTWDSRTPPGANDTTDYKNVSGELSYRHDMVEATLEAAMFWTDNEGNPEPTEEKDKPDNYDKMDDDTKADHPYTIATNYNKGDWMKYSDNMTVFNAKLEFHCIEDKLVPYVSYGMKYHKLIEDATDEDQTSHTIGVGITGKI